MGGDVEALDLVLLVDAQANHRPHHQQDHQQDDQRPSDHGDSAGRLHGQLIARADALGQAQTAEGRQGQKGDAQGAENAADPMDRENVQGIVYI